MENENLKELACIQKIADKTDKNYRIQMIKHEVFFFITLQCRAG